MIYNFNASQNFAMKLIENIFKMFENIIKQKIRLIFLLQMTSRLIKLNLTK